MLPLLSLALATSLSLGLARAGAPVDITFPSQPPPEAQDNVVDDNFFGISWELSSFDTLWGKSVDAQPNAVQNYLRNLVVRISKPLRIRVGGNSMDSAKYVPSLGTVLQSTGTAANINDVPVDFGPALFDVMNGMYDKVGSMEFIIGLSMRDPNAWDNVVQLALAAETKLGNRLDALLLGNEPDLYAAHGDRSPYEISNYIPEVAEVLGDLHNAGALNNTIVGGPTICCQWNLIDLLNAGFNKFDYKYYTLQRYPNNVCAGATPQNTNLTYYLTHANVGDYLGWQKDGMDVAKQKNIPVLMSEFNSAACGGSNISSTFGAALWTIDVGLKAVTMNYSALYLHTREYGVQYNLFDPPTPETSTSAGWRTGSPYYATLFLSEVGDPSGSVVIDLNLQNSTTDQSATVAGYGVYTNAGKTRGRIVFINYASPGSTGGDASQQFQVPANITHNVNYRILVAPEVTEKTNITWAGQTVGPNGNLEGNQETISIDCEAGCLINVPGPGAALVWLDSKEKLLTGNSTATSSQNPSSAARTSPDPSGAASSEVRTSPASSGMIVSILAVVVFGILNFIS